MAFKLLGTGCDDVYCNLMVTRWLIQMTFFGGPWEKVNGTLGNSGVLNFKPPGNFKSSQYYGKHVVVFKLLGTGRDDGVLQFDGHDDG